MVIATISYQDPDLRQLRAPAHDAEDLGEILGDPGIGAFAVTRVIDQDERQVRREIDVFLSGRGVDDVVVVYLSCHGVLDRRGRLYFAAADTIKTQLGSTGIPSAWLLEQLDECRARRQVLILDCCFSGAFAHGSKGDMDLDLERRLAGQGRGRAVLTASRAGEYSFEGQALRSAAVAGSVFTAGLIEGLRTGAADADGDGYVSLDEAYDYAYDFVQSSGASQTPQRWLYGGEGAILLARSPAGAVITPASLPEALASSLDSPYPAIRIGAVHTLGEWLIGADPARALTADQKLRQIADADMPAVAAAARACLTSAEPGDGTPGPGQVASPAKPPGPQPGPRPTLAPSGPQTMAATRADRSQPRGRKPLSRAQNVLIAVLSVLSILLYGLGLVVLPGVLVATYLDRPLTRRTASWILIGYGIFALIATLVFIVIQVAVSSESHGIIRAQEIVGTSGGILGLGYLTAGLLLRQRITDPDRANSSGR